MEVVEELDIYKERVVGVLPADMETGSWQTFLFLLDSGAQVMLADLVFVISSPVLFYFLGTY